MLWVIIVILPKGGGDYRGIGLLCPFWKAVEILMDKRFSVIEFHDCLHGFLAGRGTGTAIMEVKLAQQLAYLEQEPLYGAAWIGSHPRQRTLCHFASSFFALFERIDTLNHVSQGQSVVASIVDNICHLAVHISVSVECFDVVSPRDIEGELTKPV